MSQLEIDLKHAKGSSASILLFGATVISWKSANKSDSDIKERLFVSSKAALDGSKAVRGGIPVVQSSCCEPQIILISIKVFPCFGPPIHQDHAKLPQHGFARTAVWSWDGKIAQDESTQTVSTTLSRQVTNVRLPLISSAALKPTSDISELFARPFELQYIVTLGEFNISTELRVYNTSEETSLEFQALLHNYIRAPSDQVLITPLQNVVYYDKTEATEQARVRPKVESRIGVDVRSFTDSVYENAPDCEVTWPGGGISIKKDGFKDLVVWNPQEQGRKIGDMEDGGW